MKQETAGTLSERKKQLIEAASGRIPCDLVLKNASYVNVFSNEICEGDIAVSCGIIVGIGSYEGKQEVDVSGKVVCPGLIDSHIHLESSLVAPSEFIKIALPHGTTTIVTDPHEITNVLGTDGIEYMLQATEGLPVDVRFMLPSCVPATPLDESGAELNADDIAPFYQRDRVIGLAEMMNAFGVIHSDDSVLAKLVSAQMNNRPIDGHAPALSGKELNTYITAGVTSDHECFTAEEGLEKLRRGQYIMIREGTAARNLEALSPLLKPAYADRCLLCTDDKHPSDMLKIGHIDGIIREAVQRYDADPICAVKAASFNACNYFGLSDRGAIAPGRCADLIVINNLTSFRVEQVYRRGSLVCKDGELIGYPVPKIDPALAAKAEDTFHLRELTPADFISDRPLPVIGMVPGEIVTTNQGTADKPDPSQDILLAAVIERHKATGHIGLGFLKGYGLRKGAVATSISHDCHNIIVIGTNPEDMAAASNRIRENHGGIVVTADGTVLQEVVLEIGGLMSNQPLAAIDASLEAAKKAAYDLGVGSGIDPFMTLSFMALSVIPELRLTTKGVFDAVNQRFLS